MTTNNPLLAKGWKPSPLMVRILTAFVFLGVVIGLVLAGIYGVYLLVLILGGLALYEFNGLSWSPPGTQPLGDGPGRGPVRRHAV